MNKERIIDYLTIQIMKDKNFTGNHHCRVRVAWILAKKQYELMSTQEKENLLRKIGTEGET